MTAHDPAFSSPESELPTYFTAAGGLIRPLAWLALLTLAAVAALFMLSGPIGARLFPGIALPGLGPVAGALLIAAFGLVACLGMTIARRRDLGASNRTGAAWFAGWPRTILAVSFTAAAAYVVLVAWPSRQATAENGFTAASILLLLATPWLLAEHAIAAVPPEQLPESEDLRTLLFLPVFFLGAQAALRIVATAGFGALYWVQAALSVVLLLIATELAVRVLIAWFLPPPDRIAARATVRSLTAAALRGRFLSPAGMAGVVRSQFGMDFSRSWALQFMRTTAAPIALLMLAFCWVLTGVTRIDLNQRGTYERFGIEAGVLKPGLHLLLPWPFGAVRHTEFGVMHSTVIGYADAGAAAAPADRSSAEGEAPASANRLWDADQPTDVSYIIASREQDRQSFQTVTASVRVLYRIGLTDGDASDALYREADPDALVHALAGRLLAQFFAARTLPSVLGENQAVIADAIRTQLREALGQLHSGVDVVAVTIEAIHPPAGAASAYRNVQAAEIEATTSIATEQGRAETTQSVAQRDAHNATDEAAATAAETVSAAQVDLTNITADDRPYRAASRPFLLERYFTDLQAALANVPLEIVDHRLSGASLPTIDLRPAGMARDGTEKRPGETTP
jgi:regulator of protease activity HflC (stomatin/prohibitin superfamily)